MKCQPKAPMARRDDTNNKPKQRGRALSALEANPPCRKVQGRDLKGVKLGQQHLVVGRDVGQMDASDPFLLRAGTGNARARVWVKKI